MRSITVLALCLAAVTALPSNPQRIVGGTETTIDQYPTIVALLYSSNLSTYLQACGGTIINTRNVLSAAHCVVGDAPNRWRVRVGSTYANSGGVVHSMSFSNIHFSFNRQTLDGNIVIVRLSSQINYVNNAAQPATISGFNYVVPDNAPVWAAGWGRTAVGGAVSEQLRHVQLYTVNQATCRSRHAELGCYVTDNMLCAGWLDVGGRDQCEGDDGSPLYHNGIVVGVYSWGQSCGLARYPSVNTRVGPFASWIQNAAR